MKGRTRRLIFFGLIIVVLLMASRVIEFYVDWLFFKEVAYESVFLKVFDAEALTGLAFGVASFLFVLVNALLVSRVRFPSISLAFNSQIGVALNTDLLERLTKPFGILAAALVGIFSGIWGSSLWGEVLVFQNAIGTGLKDPILNKDMGFYLFKLPFYESLSAYAGTIIFITLLLVAMGYAVRGGLLVGGGRVSMVKEAKRHICILAGLFLFRFAFSFYLDRFDLLYSVHGVIVGAGYADVHARLLALDVVVFLTAIAGVVFALSFVRESWKTGLYPVGLVVLVYILGVVIYPSLLQNFRVAPNEIGVERPFIEHHIAFTKFGYNLKNVDVRPFNVSYGLTAADLQKNGATIKNIRLWDESPLLKTYSQLQQIRTYYRFKNIDNDRYTIDGEYRQVMLSARELSYDDLPSKSWINEKLVFTHGNGITMGPVSRISKEGLPEFIIKDIPPVSSSNVKVTTPEIYFGELTGDYVIANTKIPEFNYPTSEGNVYSSYKGTGGVLLDSLAKRVVFASAFHTAKILLSSDIKDDSRILYNRNIAQRVRTIAPFLMLDSDPYMVVSDDGRLFWMIDAYTVSTRLPYSKRLTNQVNYMRNSVKATVDAFTGKVDLYVSDPDDAIIKVYSAIFPGLFQTHGRDAGGSEEAYTLPQGFLLHPDSPLRDLPHGGPESLLQQGRPVGDTVPRRQSDGALLLDNETSRGKDGRICAPYTVHARQKRQPGSVVRSEVRPTELREIGHLHVPERQACLRTETGRCTHRPGFLYLAAAHSLGAAWLTGHTREPPYHPGGNITYLYTAPLSGCRGPGRPAGAAARVGGVREHRGDGGKSGAVPRASFWRQASSDDYRNDNACGPEERFH